MRVAVIRKLFLLLLQMVSVKSPHFISIKKIKKFDELHILFLARHVAVSKEKVRERE